MFYSSICRVNVIPGSSRWNSEIAERKIRRAFPLASITQNSTLGQQISFWHNICCVLPHPWYVSRTGVNIKGSQCQICMKESMHLNLIHESGAIKPLEILKVKLFVLWHEDKDSRVTRYKILAGPGPSIFPHSENTAVSVISSENFRMESINFVPFKSHIFSLSPTFITPFLLIYKHSKSLKAYVLIFGLIIGKIFAGGVIFGWAYFLRGLWSLECDCIWDILNCRERPWSNFKIFTWLRAGAYPKFLLRKVLH